MLHLRPLSGRPRRRKDALNPPNLLLIPCCPPARAVPRVSGAAACSQPACDTCRPSFAAGRCLAVARALKPLFLCSDSFFPYWKADVISFLIDTHCGSLLRTASRGDAGGSGAGLSGCRSPVICYCHSSLLSLTYVLCWDSGVGPQQGSLIMQIARKGVPLALASPLYKQQRFWGAPVISPPPRNQSLPPALWSVGFRAAGDGEDLIFRAVGAGKRSLKGVSSTSPSSVPLFI